MSEGSGRSDAARRCIEALAERRDELEHVLAGRSLSVLVDYASGASLRVVLTRSGYVGVVPPEEPFEPNVELRGPADKIGAFLRQRMSLADAVLAGIVSIRMPEEQVATYRPLRDVVADILETVDEE